MKEKSKRPQNVTAAVILVQFTCVLIIIAGVFGVKRFSPKNARKISAFFKNTFFEQTEAGELLALFEDAV